ncbi:DUF3291 domain-containing protein [Ideonella margarita]|uniref:DUF3291 domain-containing protein n=1 Tax=Ideonella margarita TaxID=2984191 RepID=A0ABU9C7M5_9BURK
MHFVSITRLRLRSWRFLPAFMVQAVRTNMQAQRAEGNLSVAVLPDAKHTYWTRTVWVDEAAMRRYIVAGAHGKAMRSLMHWCDEASVVHWEQADAQPPSWQEAYDRMVSAGRKSKVHHPSEAHLRFEIARPAKLDTR